MALLRLDNTGIVFEDLDAGVGFFEELGMELEGRGLIEGGWADGVTGLTDQSVEVAMMRSPDGHSRLELSKFHRPEVIPMSPDPRPVNALGMLRVMFTVDEIDDTVARLRERHGATLVGNIEQYQDIYRLCYMRGPEGILVGIAQEIDGA